MRRASAKSLRIWLGLIVLCFVMLTGCLGNKEASVPSDPWPLAEGATPLEELLPNDDLRNAALRVLGSPKPWKLAGIEPQEGDGLIEGLPNELHSGGAAELVLGYRPWSDAYRSIEKYGGYTVSYKLSDNVPEGYTRVEAFASGLEEFGHPCTYQFVVILRTEDAVPVLAAMTSVTIGGD
ncbi:MAG: hypothetical protein IKE22_09765 [Atopobiaceae bacterium]|nr:hypothetical protein [Atopobiaceae bacterium]